MLAAGDAGYPRRVAKRVLLVVVPDALSQLVAKGEVVEGYYNPGGLFDEVHLLLTNRDRPDPAAVQPMVGAARLELHNLPIPSLRNTLGWQRPLLRAWTSEAVALARRIRPDLVRTINDFVEGHLASEIKRELGVPYVVSLHGVWDRDRIDTLVERRARKKFERPTLEHADAVIAVYQPVLRYAHEYGARRTELIYNAVAGDALLEKTEYGLARPPRLVTVNRQCKEKDPSNIIRAVADLDCTYTIVGDGPYHDRLVALVRELGLESRVEFVRAIPNDELCRSYRDYDLMVTHCDYWGLSKTALEAAIVGLPVVVNQHPVEPIADYDGGWVELCASTPDGYRAAIRGLLEDQARREALAGRAKAHAREHFAPAAMVDRTVALYEEVLAASR
jgi:glycosyltransferase involved in cell wall biosynthesis